MASIQQSDPRFRSLSSEGGAGTNKVLITQANLCAIAYKVDLLKVKPLVKELYKRKLHIFSPLEARHLQVVRHILQDPVQFLTTMYAKHLRGGARDLLFPPGPPCWHVSPSCNGLAATFQNYRIPAEILCRGEEEVARFRDWAISHIHVLEDRPELFRVRLCAAFGLRHSRLEKLEMPNSGAVSFEELQLDRVESEIDRLLTEMCSFMRTTAENRYFMDQWADKTDLRRKPGRLAALLPESLRDRTAVLVAQMEVFDAMFKRPLKRWLTAYYRVQYNPELRFDAGFLSQVGFRACRQPECRA